MLPVQSILSCPGKVFILGEYAVLSGLPACVGTLPPRFSLRVLEKKGPPLLRLNLNGAPCERLHAWAIQEGHPGLFFEWKDPHQGKGGFGASTAAFALTYLAYANALGWEKTSLAIWKKYRELLSNGQGLPPSGADLMGQCEGGVVWWDPARQVCLSLQVQKPERENPTLFWEHLWCFSATHQPQRKVATHEHLSQLHSTRFLARPFLFQLERLLIHAERAIQAKDLLALGSLLFQYGEVLAQEGFEIKNTRLDKEALQAVPGVLGVKGMGALQADGLLVCLSPEITSEQKQVLREVAWARNLNLISEGFPSIPEQGVF